MPKTITPQELIDELKSGRWTKARSKLKRGETARCCLGVAAELAGAEFRFKGDGGSLLGPCDVEGGTDPKTEWLNRDTLIEEGGAPTWAPWLDYKLQLDLARVNDRTAGFNGAIEKLEKLNGGY